jgi:hypothetical protein
VPVPRSSASAGDTPKTWAEHGSFIHRTYRTRLRIAACILWLLLGLTIVSDKLSLVVLREPRNLETDHPEPLAFNHLPSHTPHSTLKSIMSHARKNSLWTPNAPTAAQTPQLLSGKSMIITGGVTGIGRAIVLGYLQHGANVAVNHFGDDKSSSQYQTLIDVEKRLVEVPGDVGNPETGKKLVEAVVQRWGRLDVVISNAGICEFKEFLEYV